MAGARCFAVLGLAMGGERYRRDVDHDRTSPRPGGGCRTGCRLARGDSPVPGREPGARISYYWAQFFISVVGRAGIVRKESSMPNLTLHFTLKAPGRR